MGAVASVQNEFNKKLVMYREKKQLSLIKGWQTKYEHLDGEFRQQHLVSSAQLEDLPHLRMRIHKAKRNLLKVLPGAERHLAQALDSYNYVADLRKRLVEASEKAAVAPLGLNPPDDVQEGQRALDDGNPYKPEYKALEKDVRASIKAHKDREAAWFASKIRKCTKWMKRLTNLTKKIEACLEIGRESLEAMENYLGPLAQLEVASARELRSIGYEIARVERTIKRLKTEKTQLEVFSAFADPLLFKALDNGPQLMSLAEVKKLPAKRRVARLRWDKSIRAVIEEVRTAQKLELECEKEEEELQRIKNEAHVASLKEKAANAAELLLLEEADVDREDHAAIMAAASEERRRFPQRGPWAN